MTQETPTRNGFAPIAVRLAGAWILAGALAKLFLGTPADLPAMVRKISPFGLDLTFHLIIGVELALVSLAWIRPKLAWPLVLALFVFFDFILVSQLAAGADSCGCFGAKIKVSPWIMLSVDSALIVAMLAAKPWSSMAATGARVVPLAAAIVVSFAAPWVLIHAPQAPAPDAKPSGYVILEPEKWMNHPIDDLGELTRWVGVDKIPTDGKIVLWRQGCEHCAAHLRRMASHYDASEMILLVQLRDDLKSSREVDLMPDGPNVTHAEFPENQDVTAITPWELHVAGGVVTASLDEEHAKEFYEKGG